jgi:hypothetical protein
MFPYDQVKTQDAIQKRFLKKERGTVFSLKGEQFTEVKGGSLNKSQELLEQLPP